MKTFSLWMARKFVRDSENVRDARVRAAYGVLEGWASVFVNTVLFFIKLAIGLMLNSISIMADAVHTLSDTLTSAIVIISFKISQKPADEDHPYGHGRAEYIATLVIAILLIVTGIEFFRSGIGRLMNPEPFTLSWDMVFIIFITIIMKEGLGQFSRHLGIAIDSKTLEADFWHHRTDAISSVFVIIAMISTPLGYPWTDGVAAMLVSLMLFYAGYDLARDAADSLLGQPPDRAYTQKIRETAKTVNGVLDAHDIIVHSYGQNCFIGMHIEIDSEIPPLEAHDITEEVEILIHRELGAHCTVHYDPIQISDERVLELNEYLKTLRNTHEFFKSFHDVRILDTDEFHFILFDMVTTIDPDAPEVEEVKQDIIDHVNGKYPDFKVKITITPIFKLQGE